MIAPLGIVSNWSFTKSLFGRKPTHKITMSASYSPPEVTTLLTTPFSPSNDLTISFKRTLTPRSRKSSSKISVNSGSKYLFKIRSKPSTNVTSLPSKANASTNSIPMYPPPTTTTFFLSVFLAKISFAWL